MSNSISGPTSRSIEKKVKKKMMAKYATSHRDTSSRHHNQSHDLNSRNSSKQTSMYISNKMNSSKFNENKSHASSINNAKDTKRVKKLLCFLGNYENPKKVTEKSRPNIKNTCDSVRKSQK